MCLIRFDYHVINFWLNFGQLKRALGGNKKGSHKCEPRFVTLSGLFGAARHMILFTSALPKAFASPSALPLISGLEEAADKNDKARSFGRRPEGHTLGR
jgi:hypothetical protein